MTWRSPVVTAPPAGEPLDLPAAKAHLAYSDTDKDALISADIAAARAFVEAMTGTRLVEQTVAIRTDCWADLAALPIAPVRSLTIGYVDVDGVNQVLNAAIYRADLEGLEPRVVVRNGQTLPAREPGSLITVTAAVGYLAADLPADIAAALKMIVGDLYSFRQTAQVGSVASSIPCAASVEALLVNHRLHLI